MIKELGKYFGPLSPDSLAKMYIGAVYESRYGVPGEIFREEELSRYLNFVMDMGYTHEDQQRFDFWADHLGSDKVMLGMSHQDNSLDSAIDWLSLHPAPETAGIMVYAANVNKIYTDSILSVLGDAPIRSVQKISAKRCNSLPLWIEGSTGSIVFHFSIKTEAPVTLNIVSIDGRIRRRVLEKHCIAGDHTFHWNYTDVGEHDISAGFCYAVLEVNGTVVSVPCITF